MRLMEAVQQGDRTDLYSGFYSDARECGVRVSLVDICNPAVDPVVVVGADELDYDPSRFKVMPVAVQVDLPRGVGCMLPDDGDWLMKVSDPTTALAAARALVVQVAEGNEAWIGDPAVRSVPLAANADNAARAKAVIDARRLWMQSIVTEHNGGRPIFHIGPSNLLAYVQAGILQNTAGPGGEAPTITTIWGDPVVMEDGYDIPNATPFFTGPIKLHVLDAEPDANIDQRINSALLQTRRVLAFEVAPCSIVRVGPYVAP